MSFTIGSVKPVVTQALRLTHTADVAMAVDRIVTHARDLCALWPWPELVGSGLSLPANALGVISVRGLDGTPFWYLEDLNERFTGDLDGKGVWGRQGNSVVMYRHNGTTWSSGGGTIHYWTEPGCCSSSADSASVGLPTVRALEVRVILDMIDAMDRKAPDAQGWHAQLAPAMEELNSFKTPFAGPRLHTKAGRTLYLSPLYMRA